MESEYQAPDTQYHRRQQKRHLASVSKIITNGSLSKTHTTKKDSSVMEFDAGNIEV